MSTQGGFTRRGWLLFGAMALLWGVPYLFISIAVESLSPPAIVAGRTLIAALLLLPFALRGGALRAAWKHWPWVLAFGLVEMAGPFVLLGHAEMTLPSGMTGLLVATVPLFAALIALGGGDRGVLRPARGIGLLVGFIGVAIVVAGPGLFGGEVSLLAAGEVLLVAILYAIAPFIVARKLNDVPSLGTITLSLLMIGVIYLPIGLLTQHEVPTLPRSSRSWRWPSSAPLSPSWPSSRSFVRSALFVRRCSPTSTRSWRSSSVRSSSPSPWPRDCSSDSRSSSWAAGSPPRADASARRHPPAPLWPSHHFRRLPDLFAAEHDFGCRGRRAAA